MSKNFKLTSVKILEAHYQRFKVRTVNENMSLQKLINRSLHLYLEDKKYKEKLNNYNELIVSGSNL